MTRLWMSLITVLIIFPGFLTSSSAPDDNLRMVMVRTVFVRSAGTMLDFRSLLDLGLSTPLGSAAVRNMSQSVVVGKETVGYFRYDVRLGNNVNK
ncbi:hypothetical protein CDAR_541351 [Caerostris darwini]|uniref:Uncharacterized protein n=1 Tax=Caerostris darwini TaxID=1538125 RepID=A0AAV4VW65_9ARAC|nr:hypothetical protein CDAR_541351 [Caerostris darwini]